MIGRLTTFVVVALVAVTGARAEMFPLPPPGINVIGNVKTVTARHEDTFSDIARRYNLGFKELVRANPEVDPWLPGEGTEIVLPTMYILPDAPREGLVLNVPEMRLYYYPQPGKGEKPVVITHPVSIGRQEWKTPLGQTRIVRKVAYPSWYPPASVRKEYRQEHGESLPRRVPPGPDNPLGTHTLRLAIPGYLIHGTNKPYGVGMRVTHGCVRMYPEDIRAIFDDVPVDTPVYIVNQPYKAGWRNGLLYVEVHPPLDEDQDQASFSNSRTSTVKAVIGVSPRGNSAISWERAIQASNQASGVPTMISTDLLDVVAILAEAQADLKAKLAEAQLTAQAEED